VARTRSPCLSTAQRDRHLLLNPCGAYSTEHRDWSQVPGSGLAGPLELVLTTGTPAPTSCSRRSLARRRPSGHRGAAFPGRSGKYVARRPQAIGLVSVACYRTFVAGVASDSSARSSRCLPGDSTGLQVTHRLHQGNPSRALSLGTRCTSISARIGTCSRFTAFNSWARGRDILDWGLVPLQCRFESYANLTRREKRIP